MRIVYLEDDLANLALVRRVARASRHEVQGFTKAESVLTGLLENPPDLILVDLQLAGKMSGLEVVKALRGRGIEIPIIAMTAHAMVGDRERCLEAGCTDYVAKPLSVTHLLALLEQHGAESCPGEKVGE